MIAKQLAHEKSLISSSDYSQNIMRSQLYVNFSIGNIGLICLKIFVVAVWISVLVSEQFGVHMKFLCWIKNSSKTWNIAVDLTELLYYILVRKFTLFLT